MFINFIAHNLTFVYINTGQVPIMIGRKAVDNVTGELSPVIGVRITPDTNVVVPVTQSSGSRNKRRPPLGAIAMLQDEIVARRGFWRRQQEREAELSAQEFTLSQKILSSTESMKVTKLETSLDGISEKAHTLNEASQREKQRRTQAEEEMISLLPPDVISVLTEGDQSEAKAEEDHYKAHNKYITYIRKFGQKLQGEELRLNERLSELEGSMNADAEDTVRQRYQQTKSRLQSELQEQLISKMELLDEEYAALQYARQRNELLTIEAKEILEGSTFVAGSFDCVLCGVFGEGDLREPPNQELIPLLKQLIAMLESGKGLVLSGDIINMLQGNSVIHSGNINIHSATRMQASESVTGPAIQPVRVTETQLVTKSTSHVTKGLGTHITGTDTTLLVDLNKFETKKDEALGDDKLGIQRNLFIKHTYEAAKLEGDLYSNEKESLCNVIKDFEDRKQGVINDISKDLKKQLAKTTDPAERDRILLEYANNVQKLNDALEKQKQKQLEKIRKELIERRRKNKKELQRSHISEARALGLQADSIPNIVVDSHEDMDHNIHVLTQEQERMLAEQRKCKADHTDDPDSTKYEREIQELVKNLRIDSATAARMIKEMTHNHNTRDKHERSLRKKLKERSNRLKKRDIGDLKNLSPEEQKLALESQETLTEADRLTEENSLLSVARLLDQVRKNNMSVYINIKKINIAVK